MLVDFLYLSQMEMSKNIIVKKNYKV